MGCQVKDKTCYGKIDWHHIIPKARWGGSKAMDDEKNRINLCRKHHSEAHNGGLMSFYVKYSLTMWYNKAEEYYVEWNIIRNERLKNRR